MKRSFFKVMVLALCFFVSAGICLAGPMMGKDEMGLKSAMRKLWEDHITYTRNYIISALANLDDAGAIAQRLLKNQDDIGDAIKPYYGDAAGKKLSELLRSHIMIATEVVSAAKMGEKDGLKMAQNKWSANADEIAAFLSGANPDWAMKSLRDMLYKHLEYTTGEVVARLNKDWQSDIDSYDKGHLHMLMFADTLTAGIKKQFPDKFMAQPPSMGMKNDKKGMMEGKKTMMGY
jgi:hypothetical protein